MRSIIFKVFTRVSPFDGLVQHAEHVTEGVIKLKEAVEAYLINNEKEFERLSEEVIKIENEADIIKSNTRNHLHKGIFMPVDRGDFLSCLKEQDSILDACEDSVIWLQFRKSEIDEVLKAKLREYLHAVVSIVEDLEVMVKDVHRLISAVSPIERKNIKNKIKNIHFEEEKVDKMAKGLIKNLFSSDKDMMHFYHLIHVIFFLGHIADHAENVSDRLRVMMAK